MTDQELFGKLDHIGVVVKDLEKAVKFYEALGVKDFCKSGTPGKNKTLHGEPLVGGKTVMVMGKMGDVGIQVTQPIEPPSMSYEFLEQVGEGINHLAYRVTNLPAVQEEMIKRGYTIIFTSEYIDGGGEIYVDTGNNFCYQFFEELFER